MNAQNRGTEGIKHQLDTGWVGGGRGNNKTCYWELHIKYKSNIQVSMIEKYLLNSHLLKFNLKTTKKYSKMRNCAIPYIYVNVKQHIKLLQAFVLLNGATFTMFQMILNPLKWYLLNSVSNLSSKLFRINVFMPPVYIMSTHICLPVFFFFFILCY